jgi:arylsulfatase A-like enzyme
LTRLPNIVLFLTDDHGQWALGSSGNREIATPNLDYLARRGTVMANAFTPTPVCSPARACLLTGRTASQHGIHDYLDNQPEFFRRDWLRQERTLPELLHAAGYFTGIVGKWHLGSDDRPQRGFDSWGALAGDYPIDATGPARYCAHGHFETISGSKASVITDQAVDFLRRRNRDRPFFLLVGHVQTHSPWSGQPRRLLDRYRDAIFADVPGGESYPFGVQNLESRDLIDRSRSDKALANYYAAVTAIDEGVGRLIDELDTQGAGQDTLIIYTSDHGLNCGHHGIWGKGNGTLPLNMVDETIRVPLVIAGPEVVAQRRNEFVDHLDLFQTVLDACGVEPPEDRNYPGRSFGAMLEGKDQDWRDRQFCEYGDVQMIRTARHKLVRYASEGFERLFDLEADPREISDIAGTPALAETKRLLGLHLADYYARFSVHANAGTAPSGPSFTNTTSPWWLAAQLAKGTFGDQGAGHST